MSKTDIVSVTGLSKTFGKVEALKEFTLDIEPGIFGLIGPNGAGKTTLIRVLLGLIHADAGQAKVLGMDVRTQSLDIRRRIGVLHERPSFTPTRSTLDYLQCIKQIYRSQSDPKELLASVGLEDAHDRQIMNLSAGMHQRLGIAQALIGDPELVFLDEPTSNLDVDGRDEIIQLIVNLNSERGVSFFISSHILSEVERACHHIGFMKEGKIKEVGRVRDIIQRRTQSTFRVICSDPQQLHDALRSLSSLSSSVVSGANSITIVSKENEISSIKGAIDEISKRLKIRVYEIEKASTLEDAYREAMRDE